MTVSDRDVDVEGDVVREREGGDESVKLGV